MDKNEIKPVHRIARGILLAVVLTGTVIVVALVAGYIGFEVVGRQAEASIGEFKPETAGLYDGVYYGEYKVWGRFSVAKVEFEIDDGELTNIEFPELFHTPGYSADKEVRERIADSGDLRFDTVTGATRTSSFAKAAIKDAVITGPMMEYGTGLSEIDFR